MCKCKQCKGEFTVQIDKLGHCPNCGKFAEVEILRVRTADELIREM
jgi:hypothetical protein